MKNCPFCGKHVKAEYPYMSCLGGKYGWNFNHHCDHAPGKLGVCIDVWGDTEEEVIERWNNRGKVKKSESL